MICKPDHLRIGATQADHIKSLTHVEHLLCTSINDIRRISGTDTLAYIQLHTSCASRPGQPRSGYAHNNGHDFDHHPSSSNSTPAHSNQAVCLFLTAKDHRQAAKLVQVKALLPQSYSMMKHPSLCDPQALLVTTAGCHRPSHGRSHDCKQLRFTVTGQSSRLLCICIHTALLACDTAVSAACPEHLNALLGF